jgi:hypothetical protein
MSVLHKYSLHCIMPWKAFFMDERDGVIRTLPCCANWINRIYGILEHDTTVEELWNSKGAQEIRRLIIEGRQGEICSRDCPWLYSGRFTEVNLHVIPGTHAFEENQHLNIEEICARKLILRSRPMLVRVIPTLECNIQCRMCNQKKHKINISEKFRREIFELGPYLYDLQLHGGEVIISHEFERWTSSELFGKNPDLKLSLITNATTIPKKAQAILEDVRINYITVSINAASRSTYAFITASDLFENVIRNTIFLRDLGLNHRRGEFDVYLSFVIMKSNYHELPDFINLAHNIGVPFRLLLVIGDRESIYTDTLLLNDVSFTVESCIKWVADGDSIKELYMIHDALKHHIGMTQNNVDVKKT